MLAISHNNTGRTASAMTTVFAALGDETRLAILDHLRKLPDQSISDIAGGFSLTRQGVTRHLDVLENAGLISRRRTGRECRFRPETENLARAQAYLAHASQQWDAAISRLNHHLQEGN